MQATPPPAMPPAATASVPTSALAKAPPPSTVKGASATATVAADDRRLVLTKSRRSESALVRYQVFMKIDVDRKAADPANQRTAQCGWRIRAYVQRSICFWSMAGLFSCTDPVSRELADAENGAADLGPDGGADVCDLSFAPSREARERADATLKAAAQGHFDEDYELNVKPQLLASGVKISKPKG